MNDTEVADYCSSVARNALHVYQSDDSVHHWLMNMAWVLFYKYGYSTSHKFDMRNEHYYDGLLLHEDEIEHMMTYLEDYDKHHRDADLLSAFTLANMLDADMELKHCRRKTIGSSVYGKKLMTFEPVFDRKRGNHDESDF